MPVRSACYPEHSQVSDVTTGATDFSAERTSGEGEVWGEGVKCAGVVTLFKDR